MFVDIGLRKCLFSFRCHPGSWTAGRGCLPTEARRKGRKSRIKTCSHPAGSDILVQVKKGPIGNKGPRITTDVSLAGRYLVLMPFNDQCGISRKIDDPRERERLRKILRSLEIPMGWASTWRTVGHGHARYFVRDHSILHQQWDDIQRGHE
jgi:ribonuclease G